MLKSIWSFGGWGVSLTRPVLDSVRLVRSFSIIRPVLESVWPLLGWLLSLTRHVLELSGRTPDEESVLLAPSWHLSRRWEGSVFYTPRAGICLVVRREGVY